MMIIMIVTWYDNGNDNDDDHNNLMQKGIEPLFQIFINNRRPSGAFCCVIEKVKFRKTTLNDVGT